MAEWPGRAAVMLAATLLAGTAEAANAPCRLKGIDRQIQCGTLAVAENPDRPDGRRIDVHYAVVPALARARALEPVFVFAGGPGQSARATAAQVQPLFARLNARRDIVYVDQRGTGSSNALDCPREQPATQQLAALLDSAANERRIIDCLRRLAKDNDLRQYATWIAVGDIDAVRAALGYSQINLWGASYGTRTALEYLRRFPARVRSAVLDGAAPADMTLPASFAVDAQASLDALIDACKRSARCNARYPDLAASIDRLLERVTGFGIDVEVAHPLTGRSERVRIDRDTLATVLRVPLYSQPLAALLPYALAEAVRGNFAPLLATSSALSTRAAENFAEGMHFAVVCAEDMAYVDADARRAAEATRFGTSLMDTYADTCTHVPTRPVPEAFYWPSNADVPVLILSGGVDPVTPPRHGEALARRLKRATHVIAPHLAHGVSMQGCAPELITEFIRRATAAGLSVDCLTGLPAPDAFTPPAADAAVSAR
jgi:pimeloyl-ACP methyl ester carboxylesterase